MYEYDKEHWKAALYDAVEFDELEEEETEDFLEAAGDMLAAVVEVLRENGYCTSPESCKETIQKLLTEQMNRAEPL